METTRPARREDIVKRKETKRSISDRLLRRYRKAAGFTAQRLADAVCDKHPEAGITNTVVFSIESGRGNFLTVPELVWFAEALEVRPILLLCDCEQPYVVADSGPFAGLTPIQVIDLFDPAEQSVPGKGTSTVSTAIALEDNLTAILRLGKPLTSGMFDQNKLAISSAAYQVAELRGDKLGEQLHQLKNGEVVLPDAVLKQIADAWQILRFFKPELETFECTQPGQGQADATIPPTQVKGTGISMGDVASTMAKTLSELGGFAYSSELIAAVRKTYGISESRQRRAMKRAGIKGARTSQFGGSKSVYYFPRFTSEREARKWAESNPTTTGKTSLRRSRCRNRRHNHALLLIDCSE